MSHVVQPEYGPLACTIHQLCNTCMVQVGTTVAAYLGDLILVMGTEHDRHIELRSPVMMMAPWHTS